MKKLLLLLVCSLSALGAQRVVVPTDTALTGTYPAGAPWNAMTDFRMEIRMNWISNNGTNDGLRLWNFPAGLGLSRAGSSGNGIRLSGSGGSNITLTVGSCPNSDVIIGFQRLASQGRIYFNGRCADGSGSPFTVTNSGCTAPDYANGGCVSTSTSAINFVGSYTLTQYASDLSYSWVRFYSDVTVGALPTNDVRGALISACEFEGNLTCTGSAPMTLGTTTQNLAQISYASSATYAPVSNPRFLDSELPEMMSGFYDEFTIRAGVPATLDGSTRSYSLLDDEVLTCRWAQVMEGTTPTTLVFSNRNSCSPQISNSTFGQYRISLFVTDSGGSTASKTITVGAVASDDSCHVIIPNTTLSSLFSPLLRFGCSEWPYFDERAKAWTDYFGANLGVNQTAGWMTALGTATVVNGNNQVVGASGTNLKTLFCSGGTSSNGNSIAIWHTISGAFKGKLSYVVSSCHATDNQVTIASNWPLSGETVSFSLLTSTDYNRWYNGDSTENYYDNGRNYWQMWLRTGLEKYKGYADWLSEAWFGFPVNMDYGFIYTDANRSSFPKQNGFRRFVLEGILAYAAVHNNADWMAGLESLWDYMKDDTIANPVGAGIERENAFRTAYLAMCGEFSTVQAAACRSALADLLTNYYFANSTTTFYGQRSTGEWVNFYDTEPSRFGNYSNGRRITINNGDSCVTPPASWSGGAIDWNDLANKTQTDGYRILFFESNVGESIPLQSQLDSTAYRFSWNSGTSQICLKTATTNVSTTYGGTGGVKGYTVYGTFGFGTQPFFMGLVGRTMKQSVNALSKDTATYSSLIATIKTNVRSLASWLTTTALDNTNGGILFATGYLSCTLNPSGCAGGPTYSGEIYSLAEADYRYNGALAGWETLAGQTWGYLGGPAATNTVNGDLASVNYNSGGARGKFLGFYFGYGGTAQYTAIHRGIEDAASTSTTSHYFALPSGTDTLRVTVSRPDGTGTSVQTFTSSPAAISIDPRYRHYNAFFEYLASGAVKRSSGWQQLKVK